MVSGLGCTPQSELCGEARLLGVETPKGTGEPMAHGTADQRVLVIEVPDLDTEEVGVPDDRSRGGANSSFEDVSEETGRGR